MSESVYLERIRAYFQDYLPAQTQALEDPENYYSELADQISDQVEQVSLKLEAASHVVGEGYLERVGRLNAVRAQAEEMALSEILYSIPPEELGSEVDNPRDVALAVLTAESNAVDQRLEMEDGSAEAIEWERTYPHLIEEVRWMQTDHGSLGEEEKRAQLQAIFAARDSARPTRQD